MWPIGTEVISKYSYLGKSPEDLTFNKGEILKIIATTSKPNCYIAQKHDGVKGLIPSTYCEPKTLNYPWFYGKISREHAEELLKNCPDGHFLIRESTNFPGDYTLCLICNKIIEHYHIINSTIKDYDNSAKSMFTIDNEIFFENLLQLVKHYSLNEDGLVCLLTKPVPGIVDTNNSLLSQNINSSSLSHTNINQNHTNINQNQKSNDIIDGTNGIKTHVKLTSLIQNSCEPFSVTSITPAVFKSAGWAIKPEALIVGDLLGKGEFGDVLLGDLRGKKVAIKTLKDKSAKSFEKFLAEASIMTGIKHANVVRFLGVAFDERVFMVLEFMPLGNLLEFLRSRGRNILTHNRLIHFACDCSKGMTYLETKKIVHRDLAARNVLLDQEETAKISDFGLARELSYFSMESINKQLLNEDPSIISSHHITHEKEGGGKFPIKWTAPEALRDNSKFSSKSDIWSYGVLLWEIFSFGKVPYSRIPLCDVIKHIEKGYRLENPEGCPESFHNLMMDCWSIKSEMRPTFKIIHSILQKYLITGDTTKPPNITSLATTS